MLNEFIVSIGLILSPEGYVSTWAQYQMLGHLHCEIVLNVRIVQVGFWSKRCDIGCEQSCAKFGSQATV